ncbi:hypothetical protein LIA77_00291 [Sarocladium implicatum]|nr:hypothetical protein LIA77_00291 [Sarocladium implicatum]
MSAGMRPSRGVQRSETATRAAHDDHRQVRVDVNQHWRQSMPGKRPGTCSFPSDTGQATHRHPIALVIVAVTPYETGSVGAKLDWEKQPSTTADGETLQGVSHRMFAGEAWGGGARGWS